MAVISSNVNADVIIIGAEKSLISTINILSLYFQLVIIPKLLLVVGVRGSVSTKSTAQTKSSALQGSLLALAASSAALLAATTYKFPAGLCGFG